MENNEKKQIKQSVVKVLVNPRTKEYKDVYAKNIYVNGVSLDDILKRLEAVELGLKSLYDTKIKVLEKQTAALKVAVATSQKATNGKIANIENSIKDLGGKL